MSTDKRMKPMHELKWKLLNIGQVTVFFLWTMICASAAILILLVTFRRRFALLVPTYVWGPSMISLAGGPFEVKGSDNIDFSKPHIFIMNHQSTLDIVVAYKALPVPLRFITKNEVKYFPFLGWFVWAMGMIFVNRSNSDKSIKTLKRAALLIKSGANVIAFPEGTRSDDGTISQFKKGVFIVAIESGVPIVPMAVEGSRFSMPKNTFKVRPHPIRVSIGKPIPTAGLAYKHRDKLIKKVRDQIIEQNLAIGGQGGSASKVSDREIVIERQNISASPMRESTAT